MGEWENETERLVDIKEYTCQEPQVPPFLLYKVNINDNLYMHI